MGRLVAILVALLVTLMGTGSVWAQSAADKETARNLMDVGDAKIEDGDLPAALEAYEGADKIMEVPTTGIAVGKLRIKLGKLVEARDVLLRVTRFPAAPDEPEVYTAARKEARKLADELTPRIPSLRIEIEGVDDDATLAVTVGGVVVPPSTLKFPRSVSPGDHEVVARAPGYKPARAVVHIEEREQKTVELRLEKDPNYEPVEPRPGFKPPPGGQDGGVPPEPGPELSPLVWVGIAVAGVGVVAGAITGGIALNNSNNIEDGCPTRVCNIELENDINATRVLSHVSTASFALAGAGAAVMVVGLVLSDWSGQPGDDQTRLEPVLGPGMLGVRGRF